VGFFGDCIGKSCTFAAAIERQKAVRRPEVLDRSTKDKIPLTIKTV